MRVLFLTDSLSDLDGVGRYALRLIQALERARPDMEIEVLLARKHRPTSSEVPAHWNVRVALPPDYFMRMSPLRFWISYLISTWHTWRAARKADLVHAIKDYPHNRIASMGARLAGKPCVATAHGTYTVQPLLDRRHRRAAKRLYRRLSAMVFVSGFTRRLVFKILGPGEVAGGLEVVVPNAVSTEHYQERRGLEGRPWCGKTFSLAIGEIKERKGHHLSLAAFCRIAGDHPDWHHFIVGKQWGDEYQAQLEAIVASSGLGQRVHFLGNVEEVEKVDLLQRAELFIHTPVTAADGGFEGFGLVYLEAGAAGTTSIGTLDSGAEDALIDGQTGLLVPQDVGEIAGALTRLMGNDELRAGLARGAHEHARASDWDANARAVLDIYARVSA